MEFFFLPFLFQRREKIYIGKKKFFLNFKYFGVYRNEKQISQTGGGEPRGKKMTAVIAFATPVREEEPRFRRELVKYILWENNKIHNRYPIQMI